MLLTIRGVQVLFPYDYVYPEQYAYMTKLITSFQQAQETTDSNTQVMLEMPTGTGKTVCLLAATLAWLSHRQDSHEKIIFCSRTISELEKVCTEVKNIFDAYKKSFEQSAVHKFLAVILTSRKNLCVNDSVLSYEKATKSSKSSKKQSSQPKIVQPSTAIQVDTTSLRGFSR